MIRTPGFKHYIILCILNYIIEVTSDCMGYESMTNLDVNRLKETVWWEYQIFNPRNLIEPHECLNARFYVNSGLNQGDPTHLTVIEDFINIKYGRDGANHVRKEYTLKQDDKIKGYFTGHFPSEIGYGSFINYQVLHTDYEKWMLVFVCSANERVSGGMVLTKEKTIEQELAEKIEKFLRGVTLKRREGRELSNFTTGRDWYSFANNGKCKDVVYPVYV